MGIKKYFKTYLTPQGKINLRLIIDLNIQQNHKIYRRKQDNIVTNLGYENNFQKKKQQAAIIKEGNTDRLNFTKIKLSAHQKTDKK